LRNSIPFFSVDSTENPKTDLLIANTGLTGYGFYISVLRKIFGGEGYYIRWDADALALTALRFGLDPKEATRITNEAVRIGLFDARLYQKYRVLTSAEIQQNYFSAVSRRKKIEIDLRLVLVDLDEFCAKNEVVDISVDKIEEIADRNTKNVDISKQRKEEKRKEKDSKVEKLPRAPLDTGQNRGPNSPPNVNLLTDEDVEQILRLEKYRKKRD